MSGAALRHNPHVPFKFARLHSPSSRLSFRSLFLQPPFLSLLPLPGVIYSGEHYITIPFLFFCFLHPILDCGSSDIILPLHSFVCAGFNWFRYPKRRLTYDSLAGPLHWEPTVCRWLEFLFFLFGLVRHSASILCLFFSRQYSTLLPDTWLF